MSVKICASVTATSLQEVKRMMKKVEDDGADIIEVRVDYIQGEYNFEEIRKISDLPLIATIRPFREGGLFKGLEEERVKLLSSAAESGFDFVDVELSTEKSGDVINDLKCMGVETVVSAHIFDSIPDMDRLDAILRKEKCTNADVCKIVMQANEFVDNLTCLRFVEKSSKNIKVVCFCLSEIGITSRLLSPLFGGYFTYASVEKGREAASGQLTVAEMREFYKVLGV